MSGQVGRVALILLVTMRVKLVWRNEVVFPPPWTGNQAVAESGGCPVSLTFQAQTNVSSRPKRSEVEDLLLTLSLKQKHRVRSWTCSFALRKV